jgi:hypothetical protein
MSAENQLWILSYNHSQTEWSDVFTDPRLAVIDIARELGCTQELSNGVDADFWTAIDKAYVAGDWKGMSIHELDFISASMVRVKQEDLTYTLQQLAEVDQDFSQTNEPG